jgi:protein gp37
MAKPPLQSEKGRRPMRQEWVESILKQCRLANVPFFFKQWRGAAYRRATSINPAVAHRVNSTWRLADLLNNAWNLW